MATITITPDLLDKLDRFRAQATEELTALNLPNELAVSLRQSIDRSILKSLEAISEKHCTPVLQQGGFDDNSPS